MPRYQHIREAIEKMTEEGLRKKLSFIYASIEDSGARDHEKLQALKSKDNINLMYLDLN